MDPPSSIPIRSSGIPRPTSRLPVLKSSASQSQLWPASSTEQLQRKPSYTTLARPTQAESTVTKKPSRASLARPIQTEPAVQKKPSRSSLARPLPSYSNRASKPAPFTYAAKQTASSTSQIRPPNNDASIFKKPIGRPPSRQSRVASQTRHIHGNITEKGDGLGDLDGFRSSSRASSRASSQTGFRDEDTDLNYTILGETENRSVAPRVPSLSERTIETLTQLPSSPARKTRRRSSFFNLDNTMPPPSRPASALGNNPRPATSNGPQATPVTPRRLGGVSQKGSLTAPGQRSVSADVPRPGVATPTKMSSVTRPGPQIQKPTITPLSQKRNLQPLTGSRPLSNSKTMLARTPKSRSSLAGIFGEAISPPGDAVSLTPTPARQNTATDASPASNRKVSNSSAALREQLAKAKAAARSKSATETIETPKKASSSALRQQIANAKEAARRANATRGIGGGPAAKEVPAVTKNDFGHVPDPAEMASFDFGLDDPFNQDKKGGKSLLRKRIDSARMDGRLNIAAMGLTEIPTDVLTMYKYDPNDNVAWGEIVDLTTIIAADNEIEILPEELFPDVDVESLMDSEEGGPQFGGLNSLDLHGNLLSSIPVGLRRLTQLTKLNLARNRLDNSVIEIVSQISTLRELRLSENAFSDILPSSLGSLVNLEVLELQRNQLTCLPDEIQELVKLRTLNISDNRMTTLPPGLLRSVPLVELFASKNSFHGSFFEVDNIPHLHTLNIANNAITALSGNGTIIMPALKTLDISANRLSSLPDMSSWTSLVTLLAGENQLTSLPDGFFALQKVRNADFTGNDITKLDERIALMESLSNLTIAANPLRERKFLTMNTEDIKRDLMSRFEPSGLDSAEQSEALGGGAVAGLEGPAGDWALKPSGTLDLSNKGLAVLDDEKLICLADTNDIRQLYLQQNAFLSIPPVLTQLAHLTLLDLSKNHIVLPLTETLSLPGLRELRLANNALHSFNELIMYLSAPALQQLDVTNNRISGALPVLRSAFPELLFLLASDNSIADVGAQALEGLKAVNLSNNEIPRLDPMIGMLSGTLTSLEVEGNTFRVPNYAVLSKGTQSVLTWLRGKIPGYVEE